ncbi:hypothetical protein TNCV_2363541 [Trichonephila clavipes]|nr:hypothetical protein TNCV_2363541 [Trichonephila clavipes]
MSEEALVKHILARLEPQVQNYVERDAEVAHRPNDRRNSYRGNYVNGPQRNQGFESRNRFDRDNQGLNNNNNGKYLSRNRGPSEHFSRGDRRHGGRLLTLKVKDDQDD